MKKTTIIISILIGAYTTSYAIPALQRTIVKTQPDGTTINLTLKGDESYHYFLNDEGQMVAKDTAGYYRVLTAEQVAIRKRAKVRKIQTGPSELTRNLAPRGLVILVNFKDKKFATENTNEAMNDMFNSPNYQYSSKTVYEKKIVNIKAYKSVREYFIDQSNGQYQPSFDVIGPVTVSRNAVYYGGNGVDDQDEHPEEMVIEACKLANEQGVDFTKYDNDHDGYIDYVYVFYAGHDEADSGDEDCIWAHSWNIKTGANQTIKLDGKILDLYACSGELSYLGKRDGIGTFCHEFSHVLGLPDLYDTEDDDSHRTLGAWDIMDYGPYNDYGERPAGYSVYEKWFMGWQTPVLLNNPVSVTLEPGYGALITSTGEHNMDGLNPQGTNFYIAENRQQTGWNEDIPGHGMLLTRIRFSISKWNDNAVNNTASAQGVELITPVKATEGSDCYKYGCQDDVFPTTTKKSYSPYSNYPLTNIKEVNGKIMFDFMGGGQPVYSAVEDLQQEDTEGDYYDILGRKVDKEHLQRGTIYLLRKGGTIQKIQLQ